MTLEKVVPALAFGEDHFIPDSKSHSAKYFTLPHPQKYIESSTNSKLTKDVTNVNRHRVLNRTASDNTFLTSSSTCGLYSSNYGSIDRKSSFKYRCESTNDMKLFTSQHSSSIHSNRHERLARATSLKDKSNADSKKNYLSPGNKSIRTKSGISRDNGTMSQRSSCSREILLEFPDTVDRYSKVSKRSEKSKEVRPERIHRGLHHSQSMPGLADEATKDNRLNFADGRIIETKPRSFFPFFRKKSKANNDISPCPSIKSSHQYIQKCPSSPCAIPGSGRGFDRTPSPSFKGRRPSDTSMLSSKLLENSLSNSPNTPSSPRSVASPTECTSISPPSTEKLPLYISRSSSKHRRHSRRSKSRREQEIDDGLRLEDLPPHPSLYRKTVEKTYSYPNTPNLKQYRNNTSSKIINNRLNSDSARRRNSMPETYALGKGISECSETDYNVKDSIARSTQNLRKKSVETSEEDSHLECITSSSDQQQRESIRSRSVPKFSSDIYLPDTDIRVISDAEDFEYSPTDMTGPISLSMCGCGFLGMYHLGVASCLVQRGPSFVERLEKVGGASVGAIMATILVTARDKIEESAEHIQSLAKEIRKKPLGPLTPGYSFTRSLRYMLDDILPQDVHEISQGKLFISVTNADTKKNELLSDFKSRDELIEALVASCFIPIYAGIKIPTIRGKKYIDGGVSNNLPKFDSGRTISVSPFDGKSDIGPKLGQEAEKKANFINVQNQDVQVNFNNVKKGAQAFFPPKRQSLQEYFDNGRYDANRFLIREGLYETIAQPQKKAVLYESSV